MSDIIQSAETSILDSISEAKRNIIEGGVTSVSSGGRSVGMISLETLSQIEQREALKGADGIYAQTIVSTPYDSRW